MLLYHRDVFLSLPPLSKHSWSLLNSVRNCHSSYHTVGNYWQACLSLSPILQPPPPRPSEENCLNHFITLATAHGTQYTNK